MALLLVGTIFVIPIGAWLLFDSFGAPGARRAAPRAVLHPAPASVRLPHIAVPRRAHAGTGPAPGTDPFRVDQAPTGSSQPTVTATRRHHHKRARSRPASGPQRVELIDAFGYGSDEQAKISVDGHLYDVLEGTRFAHSFTLVDVWQPCATILQGASTFQLCEGDGTTR